jgi:hypothetical protein
MWSHLCQKVVYLFLQAMPSLKNNFRSHPIWSTLHRLGTIYSSLYSYTTSLAIHIKITKETDLFEVGLETMAYQLNNFLGCTKVCKLNASLIINKNVCTLYKSCPLLPIMIREREKLQAYKTIWTC